MRFTIFNLFLPSKNLREKTENIFIYHKKSFFHDDLFQDFIQSFTFWSPEDAI